MQRTVKTNSDLFWNDSGPFFPSEFEGARQHGTVTTMFEIVYPLPLQMQLSQTVQWRQQRSKTHQRPRRKWDGKTLGSKGAWKGGGTDREWSLTFTADDWLPAIRAQSHSLIDRWREGEGGKGGAGREFRMGAAQNILPYRGPRRRSLMIKNVPGKACFLCMPAMLFVGWD